MIDFYIWMINNPDIDFEFASVPERFRQAVQDKLSEGGADNGET